MGIMLTGRGKNGIIYGTEKGIYSFFGYKQNKMFSESMAELCCRTTANKKITAVSVRKKGGFLFYITGG